MPQPVAAVTDSDAVKAWLSVTDDRLDAVIADAVAAVDVVVRATRYAQTIDGDEWPAPITLGSTMLAGRLVRRRNSPDGVQALTDVGAVYVSRNDPDIAVLLQLGRNARPVVG